MENRISGGQPTEPAAAAPEAPAGEMRDHFREFWHILLDPHAKRDLSRFAVAISIVIALNAVVQVSLNNWQGNIYDAIGTKDLSIFARQAGIFLVIAGVLLCLNVAQTWLTELLKVRLRRAITFNLLARWLKPRLVFLLKRCGDIGVNPDQRIQDDTRRLSELTVDLGVGLIQSSFLLIAFVGVLWQLSDQVKFIIHEKQVVIPGYMVWTAIGYAGIGSLLTWFAGRPLIRAHSDLRAREADFRFSLVRISEYADDIALFRGEREERNIAGQRAYSLLATMRHIANRLAALTWVTAGYGWLAILVPLLLAAPGYFNGSLTLGGLMMVVGGFYQVQAALRWFVDKFPAIAEWSAMLGRVSSYHRALEHLPELAPEEKKIRYEKGAPAISIENLSVAWNGDLPIKVPDLVVQKGERVLIEAVSKSGKSTFHKVLAGLWSKGSGTVRVPAERIVFLPQLPYIPLGSLRTALAYPEPAAKFTQEEILQAMERVRLGRYAEKLDTIKRWDKELTLDERRRLILGKLLLLKPEWIVADESIYELDEESREVAMDIFKSELKDTAVLSIGRQGPGGKFYGRVIGAHPKSWFHWGSHAG
jgi:putative ATP-binding cassette transporter